MVLRTATACVIYTVRMYLSLSLPPSHPPLSMLTWYADEGVRRRVDFMLDKIKSFVSSGILKGHPERIWVNPDCGLKTREWAQVLPSLQNMVAAAAKARSTLA